MKTLLKEPLVHFLLLGALLFALFHMVGGRQEEDARDEIVVTSGRIGTLASMYEKTWSRPPSEEELKSLIQEHIREEILYRAALALGLDRDDTIVRRRLRQKIEFLSEDIMSLPEPSEEELTAYLQANPDAFRLDARITFQHVYLNADERGESLKADARVLLEKLRPGGEGQEAAGLGDRFLLPYRFEAASEHEIRNTFGQAFVEPLLEAPVGTWHGPIASGYGAHLVLVSERVEGRAPSLSEVRDVVVREWTAEKQDELNEAFFLGLRDQYTVTIEKPVDEAPPLKAASSEAE